MFTIIATIGHQEQFLNYTARGRSKFLLIIITQLIKTNSKFKIKIYLLVGILPNLNSVILLVADVDKSKAISGEAPRALKFAVRSTVAPKGSDKSPSWIEYLYSVVVPDNSEMNFWERL